MKIHEYQGKELLRKYGVPVPRGIVARSPEEAYHAAKELGGEIVVVKAQIHAGGRGKGGGVKIAKTADEAEERRVMHVAMTRAEERLILSGAARLGEHWPAPGPGAAPISWIGPALVPHVPLLDASGTHGLVRTVLNSPASGILRLEAPAPVAPGEQLALARRVLLLPEPRDAVDLSECSVELGFPVVL